MLLPAAFGFLFTNQLRAALFENYVTDATGSSPEAVAIGDLNGDGRKDVAMTTSFYFNHGLVVLTNALLAPSLTISRIKMKLDGSVMLTAPYRGTHSSCVVESSEWMTNWTPVGVMSDSTWTDTNAPGPFRRFYRLVAQ